MSGERGVAGAERQERWPIGRQIVENIRRDVNDPDRSYGEFLPEHDPFQELYLRERDCCIPDAFIRSDELLEDIHELFYHVLDGVAHKLATDVPGRSFISIAIDPSYQDTTYFVVHTTRDVLLSGGHKCWHFWWESEDAMAEEIEDWYRAAAGRLHASPARDPLPLETDGPFVVTLRLDRAIRVDTASASDALQRAEDRRSNEDDADVQLLSEEIVDSRIEAATDDA